MLGAMMFKEKLQAMADANEVLIHQISENVKKDYTSKLIILKKEIDFELTIPNLVGPNLLQNKFQKLRDYLHKQHDNVLSGFIKVE